MSGYLGSKGLFLIHIKLLAKRDSLADCGEPVWPSGKVQVRLVNGWRRFHSRASVPLSLQKLWFMDTVFETLPREVNEKFNTTPRCPPLFLFFIFLMHNHSGDDSAALGNKTSLRVPRHTPPSGLSRWFTFSSFRSWQHNACHLCWSAVEGRMEERQEGG